MGGGEKGEGLRRAMNACLWLTAHSGIYPREGRKSVVAGVPFSQENQRDLVDISVGVSNMSYSWAQIPGKDTTWGCDMVVGQCALQAEKQSHRALLPYILPEFTSLCPWCWVMEYVICKSMNSLLPQNHFFPWTKVHSMTNPVARVQGDPTEVQGHHYHKGKINNEAGWFPQHTPSPHIMATLWQCLTVGDITGISQS